MKKLDLLLHCLHNLKKDIQYYENQGYIISDFVKSTSDNLITYLETQKRQEKIHKTLMEIINV